MAKKDSISAINAAAAKAADHDIHASSIPNEIKLMVQLANSCQVVVEDVFNRIKGVYARHGFRLLMLYADRICDEDTYGKLFKTLRQMPTRGIFSDTDIARFTNNGKR